MTPKRFPLIVFDWDGTLFDSTGLIVECIQGACRELGIEVPDREKAAYVIGLGLRDTQQLLAPGLSKAGHEQLGRLFRDHYLARQHALVLFDGTLDMLQALKDRGHKLAIATGKTRRGLDEALRHVALGELFDASRTADETRGKPDPLMLKQLLQQFALPGAEALMIGDTTHDLQMARLAGVPSVGVSFGAHPPDGFAAHGPLHVAGSTADLHDWLLRHG